MLGNPFDTLLNGGYLPSGSAVCSTEGTSATQLLNRNASVSPPQLFHRGDARGQTLRQCETQGNAALARQRACPLTKTSRTEFSADADKREKPLRVCDPLRLLSKKSFLTRSSLAIAFNLSYRNFHFYYFINY